MVEVGAALPRRWSPRGIRVPADGVEDGAGDLCVLELEMVGDSQDLGADMLGREGGNELGGVLRGTDLPFGPAEAVGPAVEALVDEQVREGCGGVQRHAERAGTVGLGEAGRVLSAWQGGVGGPGAGGAQQVVGAQRGLPARGVGVERYGDAALGERACGGIEGGDLPGGQRGA